MFDFLVNAEGGLTAAGYALCIGAGIVLFAAAIILAGRVTREFDSCIIKKVLTGRIKPVFFCQVFSFYYLVIFGDI